MKIIQYTTNFFNKGHERSIKAKKNIVASFFIKGANIAIGLALVPITLNYLDPTKYGIWITLSSVIGWFGFFDIGLGHGLRNRFAEALANGEKVLARTYVSTTYAIISIIIGITLVLFYVINPFLNWNKILNAGKDINLQTELGFLALIVFTFFCLRFIFKLITTLLLADQRPAKASLFDLLGKIIALILIFILTKTTQGSLLYIGIVMSSAPVFVLVISSIWFFNGKYKLYRPNINFVDFSKSIDLLSLGIKFFIIQIAAVLLYQTNNIIITQLFGPAEVTPYNIAFKYFSIITMISGIILTPFWSAITEAWIKKELNWIKKTMHRLIQLWGALIFIGIIMLLASSWIYKIWVGQKVAIPFSMSFLVLMWIILNVWNSIFGHFLNGVSKIKLQLYAGLISAFLNIPLAIFLGKRIGINGILLANIFVILIGSLLYPIQYYKLIENSAKNIWNK